MRVTLTTLSNDLKSMRMETNDRFDRLDQQIDRLDQRIDATNDRIAATNKHIDDVEHDLTEVMREILVDALNPYIANIEKMLVNHEQRITVLEQRP